jgi:cell division protein ZapB
MDVLTQLTEKISLLLERQDALKLENAQLKEALEQERQTKEAVLARVENILNRLQEVDRN